MHRFFPGRPPIAAKALALFGYLLIRSSRRESWERLYPLICSASKRNGLELKVLFEAPARRVQLEPIRRRLL
jgi:hypothetical protein